MFTRIVALPISVWHTRQLATDLAPMDGGVDSVLDLHGSRLTTPIFAYCNAIGDESQRGWLGKDSDKNP